MIARRSALVSFVVLIFFISVYAFLPVTFYNEVFTEPVLVMRGLNLYRDLLQHHAPGLRYLLLPIYWLFPHGNVRFFACVVAVPLVTAVFVYALTARHFGQRAARLALAFYLLVQPLFEGRIFWLDGCNGCLAMAATMLATSDHPETGGRRNTMACGWLVGLGITIKQTFGGFALVFAWLFARRSSKLRWFALALAMPLAGILIAEWALHSLEPFIEDAILYNVLFKNRGAGNFAELGFEEILPLVTFLAMGALAVIKPTLLTARGASDAARNSEVIRALGACALVSLTPIFPRFAWEHLQQSLPFLAILFALLASRVPETVPPWRASNATHSTGATSLLVAMASLLGAMTIVLGYRIDGIRGKISFRGVNESYNSRPEVETLRSLIRRVTSAEEQIYIWGGDFISDYALAERMPAARDVYPFPWMFEASRCTADLESTFERQGRLTIFLTDSNWENVSGLATYFKDRYEFATSDAGSWIRIGRHR
jgi:hypothetical protein